MKARLLAVRICACSLLAAGAVAIGAACLSGPVENILANIPFDGGYLGRCESGAKTTIPASQCLGFCYGPKATAICVGSSYSECSCIPSNAVTCDSGCCEGMGYKPVKCEGKVVTPDPAEGQCDAEFGYLVCNADQHEGGKGCYATFSCEIPQGFTLYDAGPDAQGDARHPPMDGAADVSVDASPDVTETGSDVRDARTDARDGGADTGLDSPADAPSDAHPVDGSKG
jgi:hypothetical protein